MNNKQLYSLNDAFPMPAAHTLPQMTSLSEVMSMPGVSVQAGAGLTVNYTPVFTLSKATKQVFTIDATPLMPSKLVLFSGSRFEAAYTKQLSDSLFNNAEKLDHRVLMALTSLSDIVEETHRPIRLMSQALHKKLPTICKVLNDFYLENRAVIRGISQQFLQK